MEFIKSRYSFLFCFVSWALTVHSFANEGAGSFNNIKTIENNIGFDQKLGARIDQKLNVLTSGGKLVSMSHIFESKKPVVFAFAYYSCPRLCSLVLENLFSSLDKIPYLVGKDYTIAVMSIDPNDKTDVAAEMKENHLNKFRHSKDDEKIFFLTGGANVIAKLTESVGFRYSKDENSGEYAHPAGALVLTKNGVVSHYLLGLDFPQRDLRLALVDASKGLVGTPIDKFLLYCYHYDVSAGTYNLQVYKVLKIGGLLTVLTIAVFVTTMILIERKRQNFDLQKGFV